MSVKADCTPARMYPHIRAVHHAYMVKKRMFRRTFMRQWREHAGLTLERAANRIGEATGEGLTHASLSRIERGLQPYSQAILEAAADAYQTDPASLLMRDPTDPDAIWSIWDRAKPGERRTIEEMAQVIVRGGARIGTK